MKLKQILFLALFSLIFLLFFFNRGFAYYDEGFILHAAQRAAGGEVPYRDFEFIYTPGTILLSAFVFKLFGESVLTARLLALFVNALTSLLIFQTINRITGKQILSWLAFLIYLSWGPSHINFPWPTMFAFSTGLLATYLSGINPVFSGVFVVVTGLVKQNFGAGALISSLLGFIFIKEQRKFRKIILFGAGFSIASFTFIIYLFLTGSLQNFLDNVLFTNIKVILIDKALSTGFPSGLKGLTYLFPGIISLIAVFVTYKQHNKNIIYPLFTLFFYLFGIRPTTDYPHLVVLMASEGIPISMLLTKFQFPRHKKQTNYKTSVNKFTKRSFFEYLKIGNLKFIWIPCILFLEIFIVGLGFYTAVWKNYYKWDSPLIKQNYFLSHPRAKINVDAKYATVIPQILSFVEQKTKKDDYIFVFYNAPMFYFLTDRKNPTRFINFSPDKSLGESREREVINNLKNKKVKLIITHEPPEKWGNPQITDFILKNFRKQKQIFEFGLWKKG